tara:strand:- start:1772 stop:2356 length:585 start_codon:yes stop_codon:yes gene_type:complete
MPIANTVHVSNYIRRQTEESKFSHTSRTWDQVADEVKANIEKGTPSKFQPRALEVPINPSDCYTSVTTLVQGQSMQASFESRFKGEAPRKTISAIREFDTDPDKMEAKSAFVVIYPSTLLAEDGQNELEPVEGNWEMISLNASPTIEATPIAPDTLMHNHFGSDGGTATGLSDADFVSALRESFTFWKDKAMQG